MIGKCSKSLLSNIVGGRNFWRKSSPASVFEIEESKDGAARTIPKTLTPTALDSNSFDRIDGIIERLAIRTWYCLQ